MVISISGPPDGIINISPDTITACSFVVQWSEPSSDPVCGTVWYTVTISTEGGILIITDNTTMTSYNVTGGLNDNTVYHVNVTASNNAGNSSSATTSIRTNSNGKLCICNCMCVVYLSMIRVCRYYVICSSASTNSYIIVTVTNSNGKCIRQI